MKGKISAGMSFASLFKNGGSNVVVTITTFWKRFVLSKGELCTFHSPNSTKIIIGHVNGGNKVNNNISFNLIPFFTRENKLLNACKRCKSGRRNDKPG